MSRSDRSGFGGKRWLLLAVAVLLVAGLVWGITGALAESGSPSPASGGKVVLKVGLMNKPDSLNPFVGYENSSYEVWCLNYDFLVGYAPDGSARPALAESWSTSADGKTWTFKIRQGATWQDGVPVTANDVAFTYNYIVKNKLAAYDSYTKLITDAVAIDDTTCEVHCSKPKANILRLYVYVFPEHIWSKIKDPEKYKMTYPIIGSGPFQTVEYKEGSFVRLEKNPNYWGGAANIDEILIQFYTNADTMLQEFKNGTIDAAYEVPTAQYPSVSAQAGVQGYKSNAWYWEYLSFNCYDQPSSLGNPVLKDVKVRQALNWAIDKQKLVQIGWNGYARPGTTQMPPGEWPANWDAHYEPTAAEAYSFDIAKANQLLDEAGYTDTNNDGVRDYKGKAIKLRLWARSESTPSQQEGKLLADWFKQCKLKIEFDIVDDGVLNDKLYNYDATSCAYAPDYDMYIWDYLGYADPGDTLASYTTDQIEWWNDCNWSNKEFDALVAEQFSQMDPAVRLDTIHKLQEIMYVETPQVVLDYPESLSVVNTKKWDGWVSFMGGSPVYNAYNMDSYLKLNLKSESETSGSSSNTTTWIIIGIVAAIVVIAAIVMFTRRSGKQAVEE